MRRRFTIEMEVNPTQSYEYQARVLEQWLLRMEVPANNNAFDLGSVKVFLRPLVAHKERAASRRR